MSLLAVYLRIDRKRLVVMVCLYLSCGFVKQLYQRGRQIANEELWWGLCYMKYSTLVENGYFSPWRVIMLNLNFFLHKNLYKQK